jgi:holo-[acyl-carrier protein] synthase
MIYGIGSDLVEIDRIAKIVARHGDRFVDRIYTKYEQSAAKKRADQSRYYAMRFAAKEAAWKALSPGRDLGIGWQELEIISRDDGQPLLNLKGKAADYFAKETNNKGMCHLSLSDDGGMALAFVVLSAP